MARSWFGEIDPCCCLSPLLNLPAAFSQPHANHKGVPSMQALFLGQANLNLPPWVPSSVFFIFLGALLPSLFLLCCAPLRWPR